MHAGLLLPLPLLLLGLLLYCVEQSLAGVVEQVENQLKSLAAAIVRVFTQVGRWGWEVRGQGWE